MIKILLWLKALHIIMIICWFSGIFYLPRLFVYYALANTPETRQHLSLMQRKLYRFMMPFPIFTILLGVSLAYFNWSIYRYQIWFYLKLLFVLALLIYQHICGYFVRKMAKSKEINHSHSIRSSFYYRCFNEIPVFFLCAIVILTIVKPF